MRPCEWVLAVVVAAALPGQGRAAVVVHEYSGHYQLGVHYDVELPSLIRIFEYHQGYVYDFDCYDDVTNQPATIQAIAAGEGLTGEVQFMIREHGDREFGAENVNQILFDYNGGYGPAASIQAFKIHGTLGNDPNTPNHVYSVAADFSAGSIAAPFYVFDELAANLTITGDVPDTGLLSIGRVEAPHTITVSGSLLGSIQLGNEE